MSFEGLGAAIASVGEGKRIASTACALTVLPSSVFSLRSCTALGHRTQKQQRRRSPRLPSPVDTANRFATSSPEASGESSLFHRDARRGPWWTALLSGSPKSGSLPHGASPAFAPFSWGCPHPSPIKGQVLSHHHAQGMDSLPQNSDVIAFSRILNTSDDIANRLQNQLR